MAEPVQRCNVCGTENDIVRLTCTACGAALRDRVAGLNLFSTAIDVLADPAETFVHIARSEQRNYVLTLLASTGILIYTIILSGISAGDRGVHLGLIILSYFLAGPLTGLILPGLSSLVAYRILPLDTFPRRLKIQLSMYAWSLVPVALTAPVLITLAIAVFGNYLFSQHYPAVQYKPAVFWILVSIQGLAFLWSMGLLWTAFKALGMPGGKALLQTGLFFGILAVLITGVILEVNYIIDLSAVSH